MGSYCGYTEAQMLHVLHAQCQTVRLEKADNDKWRLWCLCDGLGEFEMEGTMTYVLMHAFKPHKDWADKRRADLQAAFDETHALIAEHRGATQ